MYLFLQPDIVLAPCSAFGLRHVERNFCLFCTFAFCLAGSPPVVRGGRQGGHPISIKPGLSEVSSALVFSNITLSLYVYKKFLDLPFFVPDFDATQNLWEICIMPWVVPQLPIFGSKLDSYIHLLSWNYHVILILGRSGALGCFVLELSFLGAEPNAIWFSHNYGKSNLLFSNQNYIKKQSLCSVYIQILVGSELIFFYSLCKFVLFLHINLFLFQLISKESLGILIRR